MTNAITISIESAFIDAAMSAVSKEEIRYYLKGVFIDARGFIAATNGHIAFAARCNDAFKLADCGGSLPGSLPGVIVPSDTIVQAGKAAGRSKGAYVDIERDDNGLWWLTYGNARVHFAPVDGSFPDWTRVIPHAPDTLTAAHYQPQYIGKLGDMAKALRDGKKDAANMFKLHQNGKKDAANMFKLHQNGKKDAANMFKLHQNGENPALVTFPSEDGNSIRTDCCAVLMPMRAFGSATDTFNIKTFLHN